MYAVLTANHAAGGDGGWSSLGPAGAGGAGRGGAVYSIGSVTAVRTEFVSNRALGGAGGGHASTGDGGPGGPAAGGGVFSGAGGSLLLTDSRLRDNEAHGGTGGRGTPGQLTGREGGEAAGGAVYLQGAATISGGTAEGNRAVGGDGKWGGIGRGGAIAADGRPVTMAETTLKGNRAAGGQAFGSVSFGAPGWGGGLYVREPATHVRGSALIENVAEGGAGGLSGGAGSGQGGGAAASSQGSLFLTNVTVSGNAARGGLDTTSGGVHASGRITQSTIAANTSTAGAAGLASEGGTVLAGSIVANNVGPAGNCQGLVTDGGDNLQYPGDSCLGMAVADPRLGPLEAGARTMYHPLLQGSPARDGVTTTLCPTRDQRGHTRPLDGDADGVAVCDMGAIEANDPPAAGDLLFRDGFDTGDLSRWPGASTGDGDLRVSGTAALDTTPFGLEAIVDDTTSLYVEDLAPEQEDRYRARFYFDPGDFDPGTSERHFRARLFLGFGERGGRVFALVLRRQDGEYALMARARLDGGRQADSSFQPITRGTHVVEIGWRRATTAHADGSLSLWIDGHAAAQLTGLDNGGTALGFARLGAMGLKPGANGVVSFDAFESRRDSYIGP
jgi:hypothetical protein